MAYDQLSARLAGGGTSIAQLSLGLGGGEVIVELDVLVEQLGADELEVLTAEGLLRIAAPSHPPSHSPSPSVGCSATCDEAPKVFKKGARAIETALFNIRMWDLR